jgi:hypothetical protein
MHALISRIRSRVSLALGALSVVIGVVAGLYQDRGMWYVLLLCSLPFALVLVFTRKSGNQKLTGERTLPMQEADILASIAVGDRERPLCRKLTVSHATGVAIGAFVAREVSVCSKHFHDMLSARLSEMVHEVIFTEATLLAHTNGMCHLRGFLSGIINSLSTRCFGLLPGVACLRDELLQVDTLLENKAIQPMHDLLLSAPGEAASAHDKHNWQRQVESMLTRQVPRVLIAALGRLSGAANMAEGVWAGLQRDWSRSLRDLWGDDLCRPVELPPATLPREVAEFMGT